MSEKWSSCLAFNLKACTRIKQACKCDMSTQNNIYDWCGSIFALHAQMLSRKACDECSQLLNTCHSLVKLTDYFYAYKNLINKLCLFS